MAPQTTIDSEFRPHGWQAPKPRLGLRLTVVCHASPERVGEVCWAPKRVAVSRLGPSFQTPGRPERPLGDQRISRTPIELELSATGDLVVSSRRPFRLDGVEVSPSAQIPAERLRDGVLLGLGSSVLLLVEHGSERPVRIVQLGLVGASEAMARLREEVQRAGTSDHAVLIRGPTGTGKELVAHGVHRESKRHREAFVAINLAAIQPSMAASLLFGHARGAFTGATTGSPGHFGHAEGGTLFLDEVGEMATEVQPQLLRALDQSEVQPVGGPPRRVDVRVVAATDADLDARVEAGSFRPALLYRLSGQVITIPALRERKADIATQLVYFADELLVDMGHPPLGSREVQWLAPQLVEALLRYPWPGNSRQLRAVARQMALERGREPFAVLPPELQEETAALPVASTPAAAVPEDGGLLETLERHGYQVSKAARELGMARNTLYARMRELGLPRAGELDPARIVAASEACGGKLERMARHLRVSARGLRLRMTALDL